MTWASRSAGSRTRCPETMMHPPIVPRSRYR
jgi:hypothetical protein